MLVELWNTKPTQTFKNFEQRLWTFEVRTQVWDPAFGFSHRPVAALVNIREISVRGKYVPISKTMRQRQLTTALCFLCQCVL